MTQIVQRYLLSMKLEKLILSGCPYYSKAICVASCNLYYIFFLYEEFYVVKFIEIDTKMVVTRG
jgi:hypothetical protein